MALKNCQLCGRNQWMDCPNEETIRLAVIPVNTYVQCRECKSVATRAFIEFDPGTAEADRTERLIGLVVPHAIRVGWSAKEAVGYVDDLESLLNQGAKVSTDTPHVSKELIAALKDAHAALVNHPGGDTRSEESIVFCATLLATVRSSS